MSFHITPHVQPCPGVKGFVKLLLAAVLILPAWAQTAFETASVKPSQSRSPASIVVSPATFLGKGSLGYFLAWAYDVRNYQLSGPSWLFADGFAITAKTSSPASPLQMKELLKALLAERFHLELHRENRDLPVYALMIAKGGPKLAESKDGGETVTTKHTQLGSGFKTVRTTMAQLIGFIDGSLPDPIVDRTGLTGHYDFDLDFTAYLNGIQPGDMPSLLNEALQRQLGLSLEHRKLPIEFLIVDRAEKVPVEN